MRRKKNSWINKINTLTRLLINNLDKMTFSKHYPNVNTSKFCNFSGKIKIAQNFKNAKYGLVFYFLF